MSVSIYIKNSVFQEMKQTMALEVDKSIDGIGRMCISAVDELFRGIENLPRDVPLFFGSAYNGSASLHQFNIVCESAGALQVNPSLFPNAVLNAPSCRASIYHRITSPIFNICQGRASAMTALRLAYEHMRHLRINHAIVCAAEENCDFVKQVEGESLVSSSGALYLTITEGNIRIDGFEKQNDKNMDSLHLPYGSVNILYKIHDILMRSRTESLESVTDGNWRLLFGKNQKGDKE